MKAKLIVSEKFIYDDGAIRQIVIWLVPQSVPPSTHSVKYRLVYAADGQRRIGFDNERGKGDHAHFDALEFQYRFVSVTRLLADFNEAIRLFRTPAPDRLERCVEWMQALDKD